jgi:hypothetical protein
MAGFEFQVLFFLKPINYRYFLLCGFAIIVRTAGALRLWPKKDHSSTLLSIGSQTTNYSYQHRLAGRYGIAFLQRTSSAGHQSRDPLRLQHQQATHFNAENPTNHSKPR